MTGSSYGEDIVETHRDICDNNGLDGSPESDSSYFSFFMVFMGSNLSVEFPYDIEEEYSTHEFESWNLHEPYDPE